MGVCVSTILISKLVLSRFLVVSMSPSKINTTILLSAAGTFHGGSFVICYHFILFCCCALFQLHVGCLECTLTGPNQLNFRKHIIGASYMDVFFGVETTPLYPRNIPDEATFQMNARGSAVNDNNHVIIYENTGKFGFFLGARAWWMFKVKDKVALGPYGQLAWPQLLYPGS